MRYNGTMELSARQEKILNTLIQEYIETAEPVSSSLLKVRCRLDVSPATIRNDLQELAEEGFILQPHTSAGRVPTNKAYKYFVDKMYGRREGEIDLEDLIFKEVKKARQKIEEELKLAEELARSLTEISITLTYQRGPQKKDDMLQILEMLGPSKTTHEKNIDLINKLLEELDNL